MNAWLDRLSDMGLTADVDCWRTAATPVGSRLVLLDYRKSSGNGVGVGYGWGWKSDACRYGNGFGHGRCGLLDGDGYSSDIHGQTGAFLKGSGWTGNYNGGGLGCGYRALSNGDGYSAASHAGSGYGSSTGDGWTHGSTD